MTKQVIICQAQDSMKTAAIKLNENKIGALPVVDDHNKIVGIITESDIFRVLIQWMTEMESEA
jgi:acetoin utilization protein AcuB